MRIVFVAGQCVPFHAASLDERPLGGVETGVIRLSEALQARGHEVTVFTGHEDPPPSSPRYIHLSDANLDAAPVADVLVAVREWKVLMSPLQAAVRLFWSGDAPDVVHTLGIGDHRVRDRIDAVLLHSDWQTRTMCDQSGFPIARTGIMNLGVDLGSFAGTEPRRRKRLIYSSAPLRGLSLLPRIFARVRERHPDAELHVFAGLGTYAGSSGAYHQRWRDDWVALAGTLEATTGCTVHGNVPQRQLAREFMRSAVLVYPNTFNETFCITAAEAQAAGCAIVTSDRAALPETVGEAGILIAGVPGSARYEDAFVDATCRLLEDDALLQRLSRAGLARARAEFDWAVIADQFDGYLAELAADKRWPRTAASPAGART